MREGWIENKVDQCIDNISKTFEVKTSDYETVGFYPIVSQSEDLVVGFTNNEKYLIHIEKPVIVFGDHTRIVKYIDFDFCVGADGVKILSPKNFLSPKYLFHFLQYKKVPSLGYSRHYKLLKDIDVIFPKSLSMQLNVSNELDKITELISKYDEQLKELDKLSQSIFYEMFGDPVENEKGWEVKKLGAIANATIGLTYKPENVEDNGVIVLRSGNIQNSTLVFKDVLRVDANIPSHKYVKDGDILMCTRNGSLRHVGKVAIIKNLNEQMTYGAFMTVIRSDMNSYLYGYFNTPAFRDSLIHGKTTTINQITVKMLNEISLPVPPLPLQQSFARKIEAIEAMKSKVKEAKKEAETLLAARMQYWFE